jgi:hypothetical protein
MIGEGTCLVELEVQDGDYLMVAPTLTVCSGDLVVLWPKAATQRPPIQRLVIRPPEDWQHWHPDREVVPVIVIEQLNPPRHYRITTDKLAAIHRVLTTFRPGDYERSAVTSARQTGRPRRIPTRRPATRR